MTETFAYQTGLFLSEQFWGFGGLVQLAATCGQEQRAKEERDASFGVNAVVHMS